MSEMMSRRWALSFFGFALSAAALSAIFMSGAEAQTNGTPRSHARRADHPVTTQAQTDRQTQLNRQMNHLMNRPKGMHAYY
jgi:hypothetical protein